MSSSTKPSSWSGSAGGSNSMPRAVRSRAEALDHLVEIEAADFVQVPPTLLGVAVDVGLPRDADAQRIEAHLRARHAVLANGPGVAAVVLEPRIERHAPEHAVAPRADGAHAVVHAIVVAHDRRIEEVALVHARRTVGTVRPVREAAVLPAVEPGHRRRDLDALASRRAASGPSRRAARWDGAGGRRRRTPGTSVCPPPWSKGSCQVMLLYTPQGSTRSLPNSRAAAATKRGVLEERLDALDAVVLRWPSPPESWAR